MLGLSAIKNRSERETVPSFGGYFETRSQTEERRRSSRIELEILITALTTNGTEIYGYTRDLSREGARVVLRGSLTVGQAILVTFRPLGGSEEVSMRAIVRSAVCERYGIEFCDTDSTRHDELLVTMCKQFAGRA
jgi:hypothetical protein